MVFIFPFYGFVLVGLILAWLGVVSFFVWKDRKSMEVLFPSGGGREFKDKLDELLEELGSVKKREKVILNTLKGLADDNQKAVQKVTLLRYNPYEDVGGSMSFSLCLLDGFNNGSIITSLHTRSGTRVYAKVVERGESNISLSSEEKEVLKKALET